MLPDDEDTPTDCFELFFVKPVALDVPGELSLPELGVGLWQTEVTDGAPVPEASVDEDSDFLA